jgi:hypothetical protein
VRSGLRTAHGVRLAALLASGAFALHQLRYLIAFGGSSGELAREGHAYMTELLPPLAVLVLAAALATLIRGTEGAAPARAPLPGRIAFFAAALFAIYAGQESLEGIMAAGHPGGPAALLGGDGWIALPLALAIGALTALAARALEGLERAIAVTHAMRPRRSRAPAVRGGPLPARMARLASAPLAFGLARRPPPPAPA